MKNVLLICLLFFVAVIKTYPQASVGFRGGVLYAHLKSPLPSENIVGWEAGVFSKAELGDETGGPFLQPELDYSQKGGKQTYNDSSFTLRMQYASFRLLGGYDFTDAFFGAAGFYVSYLFNTEQDKQFVKPSYFSPLAAGAVVTAGVQVSALTFAVRYDWGLTLITKQNDPEIAGNILQNSKTRAVQFTAGVSF
jgi:hypothetical protein